MATPRYVLDKLMAAWPGKVHQPPYTTAYDTTSMASEWGLRQHVRSGASTQSV
jgi:hypothetical protein